MLRYMKFLLHKTEKYNKKATNPFINNDFQYNPFKSIYEQTYIWVEEKKATAVCENKDKRWAWLCWNRTKPP